MQYTVKIREELYDTSEKNSVSKFLDIAENASVAIKFGSTQQKLGAPKFEAQDVQDHSCALLLTCIDMSYDPAVQDSGVYRQDEHLDIQS